MDIKYNFELTAQEAQLVIEALEEMPFKKVVELIFKLQNQAQEQSQTQADKQDEVELPKTK